MQVLYTILSFFILLNALFWSFACHETHCKFVKLFGITNCIEHHYHILFGIFCYFLSILIIQREYLFSK
jgi:hypothetical protein